MNNESQSWKCPSCDTLNIGRRCVVCGEERPEKKAEIKNTMQKSAELLSDSAEDNSEAKKTGVAEPALNANRRLMLVVCSAVGALIIAAAIAILILFIQNQNGNTEKSSDQGKSHTIVKETHDGKDKEDEDEEIEAEAEFIKDAVYGIRLAVSVKKSEIEEVPSYDSVKSGAMEYKVPSAFKKVGNKKSEYRASDETAHLLYSVSASDEDTTIKEMLDAKKTELSGSVKDERLYDDGYILLTLRNNTVYYVKALSNGEQTATLVFIYPKEYKDIYDGYIDDLGDGFKIESTGELEMLIEQEEAAQSEETTE